MARSKPATPGDPQHVRPMGDSPAPTLDPATGETLEQEAIRRGSGVGGDLRETPPTPVHAASNVFVAVSDAVAVLYLEGARLLPEHEALPQVEAVFVQGVWQPAT